MPYRLFQQLFLDVNPPPFRVVYAFKPVVRFGATQRLLVGSWKLLLDCLGNLGKAMIGSMYVSIIESGEIL